jgi:hypothetical protein
MHFLVTSPRQNNAVWSNVKQELPVLCSQKQKIITTQLSKTGLPSSEMSLCGRSPLYASCSESREPQRNDPIRGEGGRGETNGVAN